MIICLQKDDVYKVIQISITGIDQFCSDIHKMIGFLPGLYWRICWKFLTPTFLLVNLFILSITICFYF